MRPLLLTIAATAALAAGCQTATGIDKRGLQRLPAVDQLDATGIHPAPAVRYWELRSFQQFGSPAGDVDELLLSGGPVPRAQLDSVTLHALAAARPTSGFATTCAGYICFKYVAAVDSGVTVYASTEALRQFLGQVETPEEATLLVNANGFTWGFDNDGTGIRPASNGWEVVALRLVSLCTPVQTDRFLLRVDRTGEVRQLAREVWQKDANACI